MSNDHAKKDSIEAVERVNTANVNSIQCRRPLCQAANPSFARFCRRCGSSLVGTNAVQERDEDSINAEPNELTFLI
jgi:ribosomal protein L40E